MPAPHLLLLHGSAASGAQWRALSAALSTRFRVHAPDLSGYGQNPFPRVRAESFTLAAEAEPLATWLRGCGEPVHVVAHSYGAAVALHLACALPQRVASLLVYEPAAFHLLRDGSAQDALALEEIGGVAAAMVRAAAGGPREAGAARFVDYWNGAGAWAVMPETAKALVLQGVPKVALEFQAVLREPVVAADLGALRMPRVLLQGELSPLAARCVMGRLRSAWPDAPMTALAGAGHMGPVTQRSVFNALVERHLSQVAGA